MVMFVQANLGRHASLARLRDNLRTLDDEAGKGVVLAFNEIDEADAPNEHAELEREFEDFTWAGWHTREPIGFGPRWAVRWRKVAVGARGLARLSPARSISEAVAVYEDLSLVFLALHYPRRHPLLLARWLLLRRAHRARIRFWVDRGHSVAWCADVNRTRFRRLHRDERTLVHQGLDWVRFVQAPGGTRFEVTATGVVNLTIDGHNAPWVRGRLLPPSPRG